MCIVLQPCLGHQKYPQTQKDTYYVILDYTDTPVNESFTEERQLTGDQGLMPGEGSNCQKKNLVKGTFGVPETFSN